MIRISKDFGLLCSLTSFVAVEHRSEAERKEGRPALRRVPVKLAAGWGGVDTSDVACALFGAVGLAAEMSFDSKIKKCASGMAMRYRMAPPAQAPAAADGGAGHSIDKSIDLEDADRRQRRRGLDGRRDEVMEKLREPTPPNHLLQLLTRQAADGSFSPSPVSEQLLNDGASHRIDWRHLVDAHIPSSVNASDRPAVLATTLTLLVFIIRFPTREPAWRRAYRKACRVYLSKALGRTPAEVEAWLQELKTAGTVSS